MNTLANKSFESRSHLSQATPKTPYQKKDKNYMYIYDNQKNTIQYITSSFTRLTGHPQREVTRLFLDNIIHEDDISYFYKCEEQSINFMNQHSFEDLFNYILIYTYRVKTLKGNFIRILQESQALEIDSNGILSKTLITHKEIEDYISRPFDDFKIYDKSQHTYIDHNNCYNLTKRELEIVTLIKKGLSSLQISESLNISNNTVRTHRKNILNKSNCNSFIELVRKLSY